MSDHIPLMIRCQHCGIIFASGFGIPTDPAALSVISNCGSICPSCRTTSEINGIMEGGKFSYVASTILHELFHLSTPWRDNADRLLAALRETQQKGNLDDVLTDPEWKWVAGLVNKIKDKWGEDSTTIVTLIIAVLSLIVTFCAWRFPVSSTPIPPKLEDVVAEHNRQLNPPPSPAKAFASPIALPMNAKIRAACSPEVKSIVVRSGLPASDVEPESPFISIQRNPPPPPRRNQQPHNQPGPKRQD